MRDHQKIDYLSISGFKSIQRLERLPLHDLNVLIGSNGAGKSNLVSYFKMLREMVAGRLQLWARRQGGANHLLSFGIKNTKKIHSLVESSTVRYEFSLEANVTDSFFYTLELLDSSAGCIILDQAADDAYVESILADTTRSSKFNAVQDRFRSALLGITSYHFHDTGDTAKVKYPSAIHDCRVLHQDAGNLAAFLLSLRERETAYYQQVVDTVRLALPFFDDFDLRPQKTSGGLEQVSLLWNQQNSDYPLAPSQLSDGSLRFICLATALLQPDPPSTIIIDEPELGLHPYAITLLSGLIRSASKRMQVIIATQSIPLINEFSIDDLIVVEREDDASVFRRLEESDFHEWLEDYSIGELWDKNILGGRPPK